MWQVSPTASVLPWQSWNPPNRPAAPPAIDTTTGARPAFVTVTSWFGEVVPTGTSPKSKRVAETRNRGATPFPLKSNENGCPLIDPEVEPVSGPADGGVNWYVMWQVSPTASVLPWQSWKPPKSPAAPPAIETVAGATPTFVTATCWSGDVSPTCTSPNSRRVGEMRNLGPTPVPLNANE